MFTRILVPLDGSVRAEAAVEPAAMLARVNCGTLVFIEVANLTNDTAPFFDAQALSPENIDRELREAEAYLGDVTQRPGLAGLRTETHVASGPVAETILSSAARLWADTIVMSSHGRTGLTRWVLGSVAQKVVRRSPVPVLVVRDGAPLPIGAPAAEHTRFSLLVPLDGTPFAEEALAPAVALATSLVAGAPCDIRLVQVVDIPMPHLDAGAIATSAAPHTSTQRTAWEDAYAYLDGVATRVRAMVPPTSAVAVSTLVLCDVDAAEAIAAAAEGKPDPQGSTPPPPCDGIVMTTHGRGGLALWALGSVTERVLSHATRPLFVVRPATLALQQATLDAEERQTVARQPAT